MNPFIGQVVIFGGNFAPRGWAMCHGQLLPISSNTALFSILGTTYGGDGRQTFALPDLQGRAPVQQGAGQGLDNITLGERAGIETVQLTNTNMPPHSHVATLYGENTEGSLPNPADNMLGATPNNPIYAPVAVGENKNMGTGSISVANAGSNAAHENMQPFSAANYIIALQGVYPSRS